MRGRAIGRASPEHVWRAFTEPGVFPEWFSGAEEVAVSETYPRVGATIRWRVGRWRFHGNIVEADPPWKLREVVVSSSGRAVVTHRVVIEDGARVAYEKEVAMSWSGWAGRVFGRALIGPSVVLEARRVGRLAERLERAAALGLDGGSSRLTPRGRDAR